MTPPRHLLLFAGLLALTASAQESPPASWMENLHLTASGTAYKSARFAGDRGWTTEAGVKLAQRVLPNLRLAAGVQ